MGIEEEREGGRGEREVERKRRKGKSFFFF